jgi:hypothetical protein
MNIIEFTLILIFGIVVVLVGIPVLLCFLLGDLTIDNLRKVYYLLDIFNERSEG